MKLPEVVALAKQYDALVYVDDAHGLGVLGPNGRGTAAHFNLTSEVHFNMGTFSKSFASVGGFISGSKESIDYIRHLSRAFIFSAALPPSAVATVLACIDICEKDSSLQEKIMANAAFMSKGLTDMGFNTLGSETPVIPVFIGDDMMAMQVTKFLSDHGIFATPVMAPATPPGMALIRTSYSSLHTKEELQTCLDVFAKAKKYFNL
jgi:7-keto-8-aminopelargonate synthetase-like enzyme